MFKGRRWVIAGVLAATAVGGATGIVNAATQPSTGCDVTFSIASQWDTGFTGIVTIKDTGQTAVDGWTLQWTFPGTQKVSQGWNGAYSQAGSAVTVGNMSWNGTIAAGSAVSTGFNGTYSGSNAAPTAFAVNGAACTVNGASDPVPTPSPTATATATATAMPTSTPSPTTPAPAPTVAPQPTADPTPAASPTPAPTATPTATSPSGGSVLGNGRIQFGPAYTGDGTFYGATGEGNCTYGATSDRMIAAMNHLDYENSQACGAYVQVTGPNGTSLTIKIVDQCPECKPGDLDLSQEAFAALAPLSAGRIKISWHLLSPALNGPVAYKYKDGSSQWWCGIQVSNHRNPVLGLAVKVNGAWRNLPRYDYNYFISTDGTGCGSDIQVTDIYGNQVVDTGITISPGIVQPGKTQFGPPK